MGSLVHWLSTCWRRIPLHANCNKVLFVGSAIPRSVWAKINTLLMSCRVHAVLRERRSILGLIMKLAKEGDQNLKALHEASMKDWIGQAGMLSGAGFASGASYLNLFCLKRD